MPNKSDAAQTLLQTCSGASIASVCEGKTEASYAPFIWLDGKLYLLISELASHTNNLRSTPACSLLLLDEPNPNASSPKDSDPDPFARTRMTLETEVEFVQRDQELWNRAIDAFVQRHGETARLLASLPDFNLVSLTIISGTLIEGFGKAFVFTGADFDQARGVSGK